MTENFKTPKVNTQMMRFGRTEVGTPVVAEYFGSNKWIDYGINNDYPQELIRLYNNASPLHKSIINRKAKLIAGMGFEIETPFILNEYSKDTLNDIVKKSVLDYLIFGGYYLNIIWNESGNEVAQIEARPFEKMRIAKYDCDKKLNSKQLEGYYMSKNWLAKTKPENKPVFYPDAEQDWNKFFEPGYRPSINEIEAVKIAFRIEYPSQIIFIKSYTPGMDYYTLPSYSAALNDIKLAYEISTYHLKNVQNGLMPGMVIINKTGLPTDEEKDADYERIKESYSGADNAGEFIMLYAESDATAPELIPVQLNSSDQRFRDLRIQIENTIKQTHEMTSALIGQEVSGKLGSTTEIEEQLQFAQATVINPIQKEIEQSFNKILKMSGKDETIKLKKYVIFEKVTETTTEIKTTETQ